MAFLDENGVTTLTSDIKRYADQTYLAISEANNHFARITERTTAEWNADPSYIPANGELCIWLDYTVIENQNIPALKIGDGLAYALDLPFLNADMNEHINNSSIHVSQADREYWNNKVKANVTNETLVITL